MDRRLQQAAQGKRAMGCEEDGAVGSKPDIEQIVCESVAVLLCVSGRKPMVYWALLCPTAIFCRVEWNTV